MLISTSDLGFAAFIKKGGLVLKECIGKTFYFESGEESESGALKVQSELEVMYANSCCRQHDSNVMYLRSMIKTHPKIRS